MTVVRIHHQWQHLAVEQSMTVKHKQFPASIISWLTTQVFFRHIAFMMGYFRQCAVNEDLMMVGHFLRLFVSI